MFTIISNKIVAKTVRHQLNWNHSQRKCWSNLNERKKIVNRQCFAGCHFYWHRNIVFITRHVVSMHTIHTISNRNGNTCSTCEWHRKLKKRTESKRKTLFQFEPNSFQTLLYLSLWHPPSQTIHTQIFFLLFSCCVH